MRIAQGGTTGRPLSPVRFNFNYVIINFFKNLENPILSKYLEEINEFISLGDDRLVFGNDIDDPDKLVGILYVDINYDTSHVNSNIEINEDNILAGILYYSGAIIIRIRVRYIASTLDIDPHRKVRVGSR